MNNNSNSLYNQESNSDRERAARALQNDIVNAQLQQIAAEQQAASQATGTASTRTGFAIPTQLLSERDIAALAAWEEQQRIDAAAIWYAHSLEDQQLLANAAANQHATAIALQAAADPSAAILGGQTIYYAHPLDQAILQHHAALMGQPQQVRQRQGSIGHEQQIITIDDDSNEEDDSEGESAHQPETTPPRAPVRNTNDHHRTHQASERRHSNKKQTGAAATAPPTTNNINRPPQGQQKQPPRPPIASPRPTANAPNKRKHNLAGTDGGVKRKRHKPVGGGPPTAPLLLQTAGETDEQEERGHHYHHNHRHHPPQYVFVRREQQQQQQAGRGIPVATRIPPGTAPAAFKPPVAPSTATPPSPHLDTKKPGVNNKKKASSHRHPHYSTSGVARASTTSKHPPPQTISKKKQYELPSTAERKKTPNKQTSERGKNSPAPPPPASPPTTVAASKQNGDTTTRPVLVAAANPTREDRGRLLGSEATANSSSAPPRRESFPALSEILAKFPAIDPQPHATESVYKAFLLYGAANSQEEEEQQRLLNEADASEPSSSDENVVLKKTQLRELAEVMVRERNKAVQAAAYLTYRECVASNHATSGPLPARTSPPLVAPPSSLLVGARRAVPGGAPPPSKGTPPAAKKTSAVTAAISKPAQHAGIPLVGTVDELRVAEYRREIEVLRERLVSMNTLQRQEKIRLRNRLDQVTQEHKKALESKAHEIEELKERLQERNQSHSRSLRAYMKASVTSLRALRNAQVSNDEESDKADDEANELQ